MTTYLRNSIRSLCWHIPVEEGSGHTLCGADLTGEHRLVTAMTVEMYVKNNPTMTRVQGWYLCETCEQLNRDAAGRFQIDDQQ